MLGEWRIGEDLVAAVGLGDHVVAQAQRIGNDGGHRRDALHIHLAELFHPAENVGEFGRKLLHLAIADGDTRELRDMANCGFIYGHAGAASITAALRQGGWAETELGIASMASGVSTNRRPSTTGLRRFLDLEQQHDWL